MIIKYIIELSTLESWLATLSTCRHSIRQNPAGKKNAELYGMASTSFEGKIAMAPKPTV